MFWGYFCAFFDPQNVSKISQDFFNFWAQFWIFLLGVLELFGFLLGAFLGLLRLSWEASGPKNLQKLKVFLRFLKMQLFGSLKLLMALLGSSCPLFGRSGPKVGPKMVPKSGPKSDQKVGQKWHQKWSESPQKAWSKEGSIIKKIALTAPFFFRDWAF